jgi:hypothetical protein
VVMVTVGGRVSERLRGNVGSCSGWFRAAVVAAGGREVCLAVVVRRLVVSRLRR